MSLDFDPSIDYYSTLGVLQSASTQEINKAYRKMALKYHPDRNPGDANAETLFKKASKAKEVLTDSDKKRVYDKIRGINSNGFNEPANPFGRSANPFGGDGVNPFEDIFNNFVNFGRENRTQYGSAHISVEEGEDVTVHLNITLEEAYGGCRKEVVSRSGKLVPCGHCEGSGSESNSPFVECPDCRGLGRRINHGRGAMSSLCAKCVGEGKVPLRLCKKCHGKRKCHHEKPITVTIPSGVDEGSKLRVSGMGSPGINAAPGDLMVIIHIEKNAKFERKDSDLYIEHWIPFHVAIKGGETTVKSVDNKDLKFMIPPGVKSGVTTVRLKGKGMENPMRHTKGDLHIMLEVLMPENLSPKAEQLLNELVNELENSNKV